jgi:hypothetical protein
MSTITVACDAVQNLPVLDGRDAQKLADKIVDDVITALQRDPDTSFRSFTAWELALASVRGRVAERLSLAIAGHVDLETVLLELRCCERFDSKPCSCGWEVIDA